MTYLYLFYEFFKTGLFAVGGGLATIPFLREIASNYTWFTEAQLTDMIAVAESTPGPIGVNMATYGGYNAAGILGGVIATLSLILPSVIVITIISRFLEKFRANKLVESIFYGLRPASSALIAGAMFSVLIAALFSFQNYSATADLFGSINFIAVILYAALTVLCFCFQKLHPIIVIAAGALLGIIMGNYL